MKDEDYIKQIAEYYELPVEQVALIWSALKWYNEEVRDEYIQLFVEDFIEEKMCT
jgi:hypothetical protein